MAILALAIMALANVTLALLAWKDFLLIMLNPPNSQVFLVTSVFSLFAYIWLLVILDFISPNVVESWEAVLTFLFFPVLVLIAWWADRNWKCGKRVHVATEDAEQQIELGMADGSPGGECKYDSSFSLNKKNKTSCCC